MFKKKLSKSTRIAVVYGGISKERQGSLISGKAVYDSLIRQGYNMTFLIDPADDNFIKQINEADVVFLILHGRYGEDGKIQGYLETIGKPYTGSGVLASALGMDKIYFKTLLNTKKIPTPPFEALTDTLITNDVKKIIRRLALPLFLKPVSEGGSLGSNIIHTEKGLLHNLRGFKKLGFDKFMVEKYIKGKSLTVGVLQENNKVIVLPILETISKKEFYDYEAKHDPNLHAYVCPAHLDLNVTREVRLPGLKGQGFFGIRVETP